MVQRGGEPGLAVHFIHPGRWELNAPQQSTATRSSKPQLPLWFVWRDQPRVSATRTPRSRGPVNCLSPRFA